VGMHAGAKKTSFFGFLIGRKNSLQKQKEESEGGDGEKKVNKKNVGAKDATCSRLKVICGSLLPLERTRKRNLLRGIVLLGGRNCQKKN